MEISQLLISALQGNTTEEIIGTSQQVAPKMARLGMLFPALKLRPNYASILMFRQEKEPGLFIAHIQGGHIHAIDSIRDFDTRIIYSILPNALREIDFRLGSVLCGLPRMDYAYFERKMGKLAKEMTPFAPFTRSEVQAERLTKLICQAIIGRQRLLIHLDDPRTDWRINGVLESEISLTLFAAIDLVPAELRQVVSLALSVDDKFQPFLNYSLVILYQGERNSINIPDSLHFSWSEATQTDIELDPKEVDSFCVYARMLAKNITKQSGTDLYDTELSSREMLLGLQEMKKSVDTFLQNRRISSEVKTGTAQKLYCREVVEHMTEYPVDIVVDSILALIRVNGTKDEEKRHLIEQYDKTFGTIAEELQAEAEAIFSKQATEILNKKEMDISPLVANYPFFSIEKIVNDFKLALKENISNLNLSSIIIRLAESINLEDEFRDIYFERVRELLHGGHSGSITAAHWVTLMKFTSNSSQRSILIQYLSSLSNLKLMEDLFSLYDSSESEIKRYMDKAFELWSGWDEELQNPLSKVCRTPFIAHIPVRYKEALQQIKFNDWRKYRDLYKGVSYERALALFGEQEQYSPLIFQFVLEILAPEEILRFGQEHSSLLREQTYELIGDNANILNTPIWKLLPKQDKSALSIKIPLNYATTLTNVYRILEAGFPIEYNIQELYLQLPTMAEAKELCDFVYEKRGGHDTPSEATIIRLMIKHCTSLNESCELFRWLREKHITIPNECLNRIYHDLAESQSIHDYRQTVSYLALIGRLPKTSSLAPPLQRLMERATGEEVKQTEEWLKHPDLRDLKMIIDNQKLIKLVSSEENKNDMTTESKYNNILPPLSTFEQEKEEPARPQQVATPPPATPKYVTPSPTTPQPKKNRGILTIMILSLVINAVILGGGFFAYHQGILLVQLPSNPPTTTMNVDSIQPTEVPVTAEVTTPKPYNKQVQVYVKGENNSGIWKNVGYSESPFKLNWADLNQLMDNKGVVLDSIKLGDGIISKNPLNVQTAKSLAEFYNTVRQAALVNILVYSGEKCVYRNGANYNDVVYLMRECGNAKVDSVNVGGFSIQIDNKSNMDTESSMTSVKYVTRILGIIQEQLDKNGN